ncbi:MAG: tetratricopeptide repeat protein [Candidatus Omnitrophota bacterium]
MRNVPIQFLLALYLLLGVRHPSFSQDELPLSYEDEFSQIVGEFEALKNELSDARSKIKEYQAKISECEAQQNQQQLTQQVQECQKQVTAVQASAQECRQESIKNQVGWMDKIKDYEERMAEFQNERLALETKIEVLKAKEDSLKDQIEQLANTIKEKDKAVVDLTVKFQQFPEQVKEYEAKLAALQNENTSLSNQLDAYKTKELEWKNEISQKEVALSRLETDSKDYPLKLDKMKKQNASLKERNELMFKDNRLFQKKLQGYSRKLYQVALLKDRLLKENAVLHYNLGVYYLQKQQYPEAIREFLKDLELNPDDAAAHYNLGLIYAEFFDDKAKAIHHFKRYITLDPQDKDADRAKKYILTWEMWQDEKVEPHSRDAVR